MKEIFKDIKGYDGIYQISNLGRVKSLSRKQSRTERILKQDKTKWGYYQVTLLKNRKRTGLRVNRLVAQAFIPNPENKPMVNHEDGIKTNNRDDNLIWCTRQENETHAKENGLKAKGNSHGKSKLTEKQVIEIKEKLKNHKRGMNTKLAKIYNVTNVTISAIKTGKCWVWV